MAVVMSTEIGNINETMENGEWRMDNENLHFPISILHSALYSFASRTNIRGVAEGNSEV